MPISSKRFADTDTSIPLDVGGGSRLTVAHVSDISKRLLSDIEHGYSVGVRRQRWRNERHLLYLYGRVQGWPYAKIAAVCGVMPKSVRWFFEHATPSSIFRYPIIHKAKVAGDVHYSCRLCGQEEGTSEERVRKLIAAAHFFPYDVVELYGVFDLSDGPS
jgi:hypothetical protein